MPFQLRYFLSHCTHKTNRQQYSIRIADYSVHHSRK